jgi:putative oxidoreductase
MSYGLLLLRVVIGLTFAAHGVQKLFGWFGGGGPEGTKALVGKLGFRAPGTMGVVLGLAETSGVLFAAGFLTPLAAVDLVAVMLTAIVTVHWRNGFFNGKGGYEFNLALLTVAAAVAMTGPGRFSIDRLVGWDDDISGLWWGIGVLVVAALGAAFALTVLRGEPPAERASSG